MYEMQLSSLGNQAALWWRMLRMNTKGTLRYSLDTAFFNSSTSIWASRREMVSTMKILLAPGFGTYLFQSQLLF